MSRLYTEGFELGTDAYSYTVKLSSLATSSVSSSEKRTGGYSLKIDLNQNSSGYVAYQNPLTEGGEFFWRLAFMYKNVKSLPSTLVPLLELRDGNQPVNTVVFDPSTRKIDILSGGTANSVGLRIDGSTFFSSNSMPEMIEGNWYILQGRHYAHSSTGNIVLKVNGVTVASYTGNTASGAAIDNFQYGSRPLGSLTGTGFDIYLDDIAVNNASGTRENSYPSLGGVYCLKPVSDGAASDWTRSSGTANYQAVDELPPNTTDYVYASASGSQDLYGVSSLPTEVTSVSLVQPIAIVSLASAGSSSVGALLRHETTNYRSGDTGIVNVTPSYVAVRGSVYYEVAGGSGAWTPEQVNALQVGVEIV